MMVQGYCQFHSPMPCVKVEIFVSILNNLCYFWAGRIRWHQHLVRMGGTGNEYNVSVGEL